MKRIPKHPPREMRLPAIGAPLTDDMHPSTRVLLLENAAIVDLRNGNLDGLLAYLRDKDTELVPMSPSLREWIAGCIDCDPPEIVWRLAMVKHPHLKHKSPTLEESEAESARGIDALLAFLEGDGLKSYKRGVWEAMQRTGWGRSKVTAFVSAWRIERMRFAVEHPELDLDPIAAGLGLKVFLGLVSTADRLAAWESLASEMPEGLHEQKPLRVEPPLFPLPLRSNEPTSLSD